MKTNIVPLHGTPESSGMTSQEVREIIKTWTDKSDQRRRDLCSALNTLEKIAGPGPVPMSCAVLNERLYRRSPAAYGISAKVFANVVSALRDILRRLGLHTPHRDSGRDGLTPAWQALYDLLSLERRRGLVRFMKYASQFDIVPEAVCSDMLPGFKDWLLTQTLTDGINAHARRAASNWTWAAAHLPGWPKAILTHAGARETYTLPLEAYPSSFVAELEVYLDRLSGKAQGGLLFLDAMEVESDSCTGPVRPLKPRSIETRRYHVRQAAAALLASGRDPLSIPSLRDLVSPIENAAIIMNFFWKRAGKRPTSQLVGIADTLRQIAKYHCRLPAADVERISRLKHQVTPAQQGTMTDKNRVRLIAMRDQRANAMILHYSDELLRRAVDMEDEWLRRGADPDPAKAARLVMFAIAFEILVVCPLRRKNLAELRLDTNLLRPDPTKPVISHIFVTGDDVKNGETVEWPIPASTREKLDRYLTKHRPHLAAPGNPYLFPGTGQRPKAAHDLAIQLKEMVERDIGIAFNLHLMRHFAVLTYLNAHPGQYELVRRILGHRKIETTIRYYAGLEATVAAEQFGQVITDNRAATHLEAKAAFRPKRTTIARPSKPRPEAQL